VLSAINAEYWILNIQETTGTSLDCFEFTQPDICTRAGGIDSAILSTSSSGGVATYGWQMNYRSDPPEATARVNVRGTANGAGAFNGTGLAVATRSFSHLNVIGTEMTSGVATYTFDPASLYGYMLRTGDIVNVTHTTNGGGVFNTGGGDTGGTTIENVTGTTFQITFGGSSTIPFQAETGLVEDLESGFFTVSGFSGGTLSQQAETGRLTWTGNCIDGVSNYGQTALALSYNGAQGPINATVTNIYVHGMSSRGVLGLSTLNTDSAQTFTGANWYIDGNGLVGADGDSGGCSTNCESIGTINLTNINAVWSGCIKRSAGVYDYCVDQAYGGNGDNLVMVATGGTWNWNQVVTTYGMQDCFDSLHTGDDPSNLPTLNASNIYAEGCEGAAIKMSGGELTIRNSIGISNCKVMMTAGNFPSNSPGWNAYLGLPCRALDSMLFSVADGHTTTIINVDNIGEQSTGWNLANIGPTGCSSNVTCKIIFENNVTLGFKTGNGEYMAGMYLGGVTVNPFNTPGSMMTNNAWQNVKGGCPNLPTNESKSVCPGSTEQIFVSQSDVNSINANLISESPLIGTGLASAIVGNDCSGNPWVITPIGCYQYGIIPPSQSLLENGTAVRGNVRVGGTVVVH
jgi:hypothetical protein